MNRTSLIQGLIFVLVISVAIAGVYASDGGEVSQVDSTDNAGGLHVGESGDSGHDSGYFDVFGEAPHIANVSLHI